MIDHIAKIVGDGAIVSRGVFESLDRQIEASVFLECAGIVL